MHPPVNNKTLAHRLERLSKKYLEKSFLCLKLSETLAKYPHNQNVDESLRDEIRRIIGE